MSCENLNPERVVMLLVMAMATAASGIAGGSDDVSSSDIEAALRAAVASEQPHFHLQVSRTNLDGQRSLEVFPSGVAIWNLTTQIELPVTTRSSLLGVLEDSGFAEMLPSYGGKRMPGSGEAALRVICRVELEIGGLGKSSVQLADGEQSEQLADLADALLDLAEPLAAVGVTATDLSDGLRKLAQGKLAVETFQLRFVRLPAKAAAGDGEILTIRNGEASRKSYTPGRGTADEVSQPMTGARLEALVAALLEADVASLPVNVWSKDHIELGLQVLGLRKAVVARDFERLKSIENGDAPKRFERLTAFLLTF